MKYAHHILIFCLLYLHGMLNVLRTRFLLGVFDICALVSCAMLIVLTHFQGSRHQGDATLMLIFVTGAI